MDNSSNTVAPPGSKLSPDHENPIDGWILGSVVLPFNRVVHGHSVRWPAVVQRNIPNLLTAASLLVGCMSAWLITSGHRGLAVSLHMVSYVLDCCDGNYARQHGLTSEFGDLFDHGADVMKVLATLAALWWSSRLPWWVYVRRYASTLAVLGASALLCAMHMGCQQLRLGGCSTESLGVLTPLCPSADDIYWTRFGGCGTAQLVLCVAIAGGWV